MKRAVLLALATVLLGSVLAACADMRLGQVQDHRMDPGAKKPSDPR